LELRPLELLKAQAARVTSYTAVELTEEEREASLASGWTRPYGLYFPSSSAPAPAVEASARAVGAHAPAVELGAPARASDAPAPAVEPDADEYCCECKLDPTSVRIYAVEYILAATSSSNGLAAGPDLEDVRRSDVGLDTSFEDRTVVHIACCLWCTCQFFLHWGLLCRHMQRAMIQDNIVRIPDGTVHRRWLPSAKLDRERRQRALTRTVLQERQFVTSAREPKYVVTADERCNDTLSVATALTHCARLSAGDHARIRQVLDSLLQCALDGTLSRAASTRGLHAQQAAAVADALERQAPPRTQAHQVRAGADASAPGGVQFSENVRISEQQKETGKRKLNAQQQLASGEEGCH